MKTALFILHQKTSEAGNIGNKLKKRGFSFDIVRPSLGEELPNNLKLVAVPDSGHALLAEQHEIVQKVILEWLRERN